MENRERRAGGKNIGAMIADKKTDRAVYDALSGVFLDGAYCAKALTAALKVADERTRPFVTSAFYGVLDKNVRLEKLIRELCAKPPEKHAALVLKIGLYYIGYADMPDYAAVNRTVELSKDVGGMYSGFINAVLKKSIGFKPTFPSGLEEFSYAHCTPEWLCKALISDYSESRAAAILDAQLPTKTHIRPVKGRIGSDEFDRIASSTGSELTEYGCYCDKHAMNRFEQGTYAVQSISSIKAVKEYVSGLKAGKVLDLCAAPGGKSVLMSELGAFDVTSCDLYAHKIELIKGYAKKLGAKLTALQNDASVLNDKFINKFDLVVADCPCSGTGTLKTKPDTLLRRKPSDLNELNLLQLRILDNAALYCKPGGVLCYSTCSILKCENDGIRDSFLASHPQYALEGELRLLPDTDGCDGFYVARFIRSDNV